MQFIAMLMDEVQRTQATLAKQQKHYISCNEAPASQRSDLETLPYAGSIKSAKGINLEKKAKISYNLEHGAASNRALFSQGDDILRYISRIKLWRYGQWYITIHPGLINISTYTGIHSRL